MLLSGFLQPSMMNYKFISRLFLFGVFVTIFTTSAFAQQQKYCATPEEKVEWLKKYQANPQAYEKSDEVIFVPLTIHVVGDDNGVGFFGLERILKAFCTLNRDFEPANIRFYIEGDIRYISNSSYADHTFSIGWQMMQAENISNTINCYIVEDPAGACGYAYYSAGIALKKDCMSVGDHTWAHEVGHYLSLPHTFYGWEGEYIPEDGAPAPNYISGTQVERVDGSNCSTAADGFCDTPPDYLSDRWNCNEDGVSGLVQTDPNGETFQSDGSFFMSYADDACSNRFSEEQIQAMRANLNDDRPNLLYNQTDVPHMPEISQELISPIQEEVTGPPNEGVTLNWEPIENATHYLVQANPFPAFSYVYFEFITTETSITIDDFEEDRTYYWRVKPYSAYSSCIPFSGNEKFRTGMISTNTNELTLSGQTIKIYPNPTRWNSEVTLEFNAYDNENIQVELFDGTGRLVLSSNIDAVTGMNKQKISVADIPAGVYILNVSNEKESVTQKLIIQ